MGGRQAQRQREKKHLCGDEAGDVRHVREHQRAHFVADEADARVVPLARVGATTADNHLRAEELGLDMKNVRQKKY
jgi:hypothetical protein